MLKMHSLVGTEEAMSIANATRALPSLCLT
jgi:hypothetical protein